VAAVQDTRSTRRRIIHWRMAEVAPETISFFAMRSTLDPLWPRHPSLRLAEGLGWDAIPCVLVFISPEMMTPHPPYREVITYSSESWYRSSPMGVAGYKNSR